MQDGSRKSEKITSFTSTTRFGHIADQIGGKLDKSGTFLRSDFSTSEKVRSEKVRNCANLTCFWPKSVQLCLGTMQYWTVSRFGQLFRESDSPDSIVNWSIPVSTQTWKLWVLIQSQIDWVQLFEGANNRICVEVCLTARIYVECRGMPDSQDLCRV